MLHFSGRNTLPLTTPKRNLLLPFGFLACTVVNTVALTTTPRSFRIASTPFVHLPSVFSPCLSLSLSLSLSHTHTHTLSLSLSVLLPL